MKYSWNATTEATERGKNAKNYFVKKVLGHSKLLLSLSPSWIPSTLYYYAETKSDGKGEKNATALGLYNYAEIKAKRGENAENYFVKKVPGYSKVLLLLSSSWIPSTLGLYYHAETKAVEKGKMHKSLFLSSS